MKTDAKQDGKFILFECAANVNRSVTAEIWFSWRHPGNNYQSAGSNNYACIKMGGTPVTRDHLEKADRIICMEERNRREIENHFGTGYSSKIEVAGIADRYRFMQVELIFQVIDRIVV